MGWSGDINDVHKVLGNENADQTEEGEFKVSGKIVLFMGVGPDVVIDDDAVYYFDGEPKNIVNAMVKANCGLQVTVI